LFGLFLFGRVAGAAGLGHADLAIATSGGQTYHFDVEVAKTATEQERGLMFRKSMPADAGMVFPYERDTTTSFWMKNCYIPLDMLFVAGDGHISHIAPDAQPLFDRQPGPQDFIPSGGPIRLVVELNGGTAAHLAIHVGDRVTLGPFHTS
jgi:uncharacterized membrane protein (UPF0127 family)